MGTRNLTVVIYKDELKVAQYGQWDGYPDVTGLGILGFLLECDLEHFKQRLDLCRWITPEESEARFRAMKECGGAEPLPKEFEAEQKGFISMHESEMLKSLYPENNRDAGFRILHLIEGTGYVDRVIQPSGDTIMRTYKIKDKKEILLENSITFAGEKFCEWAWIINLDNNELQVYCGHSYAFQGEKGIFEEFESPVRLITTFDIRNLPDEHDFLGQINSIFQEE